MQAHRLVAGMSQLNQKRLERSRSVDAYNDVEHGIGSQEFKGNEVSFDNANYDYNERKESTHDSFYLPEPIPVGIVQPSRVNVRVELCVIFLKIGEIDTLKEQFEADVLIKAKWREPSLDKQYNNMSLTHTKINWSKYWNPKLFVENTIGEAKESKFRMILYQDNGKAYVIEKRRIKGLFLENLELNDFPFDVQDLTVTIMSDRSCNEVVLVNDPEEMHTVNRQSFIDEQEWHLYKCVETDYKEISQEYENPDIRKPAFYIKCRAARRPIYFFWNILLITFLICVLAFATFAVDRDLPQNRLQLTFTLVLTAVAFKFVVNQCLPKISYLTYLDKYVLGAMILLILVCIWHGVTTIIVVEKDDGRKVEFAALMVFSGSYLTFNFIFLLNIYMKPGQTRKSMNRLEKDYIEKSNEQMTEKRRSTRERRNTICQMTAI